MNINREPLTELCVPNSKRLESSPFSNDNGDNGPESVSERFHCIGCIKKLINYFLLIEGFSIGISDMIVDGQTMNQISGIIEDKKLK